MNTLESLAGIIHEPGDSFDRYKLVRELGQGGAGVVFQAHNQRLGTEVAVKIMLPYFVPADLLGEVGKRFKREIEILKNLKHPHIVSILDLGTTPRIPLLRHGADRRTDAGPTHSKSPPR